ncbi:MAG: GntR family transcriptional regulator [Lachnospiraceae bacterium]|nr:GntR family transcriptional regulator [Lachnospiraceae bacterium]
MNTGNWKNKIETPIYQKIAIKIAYDIANGKYSVGEKLSGRSTLASCYKVSPETIRRSVFLLQDLGILEIAKNSGVIVVSLEKAQKFVEQHKEIKEIDSVREDVIEFGKKQREYAEAMLKSVNQLIEMSERFSQSNPLEPFLLKLTPEMKNLGKTSAEVNFWHNTGATIIAVNHNSRLIISPGPYTSFEEEDILYFIGPNGCFERVKKLFS